MSAAYILAWRAATPASLRQANLDPRFLLLYMKWSWTVFGLDAAGYLIQDAPRVGLLFATAWATVLIYSSMRGRTAWAASAAAAALVSLNVYAGTSQARATLVGPFAALTSDRYYVELPPLIALFAGVALVHFRIEPTERRVFQAPIAKWCGVLSEAAAMGFLAANSLPERHSPVQNELFEFPRGAHVLREPRAWSEIGFA